MIDEKLFVDLKQYILAKTGISYFNRIKRTNRDIMISCPYHKDGQERKPSCGVSTHTGDKFKIGTVHCFTCGVVTDIQSMVSDLLGSFYNEDEVESIFHLKTLIGSEQFIRPEVKQAFMLPKRNQIVSENILRAYRIYHPYLQQRGITEDVAKLYDIGYDEFNKQITFPIRDINKKCIGIGRRSIIQKRYSYPEGMRKPVYGVYELPKFIRYLFIVERTL